MSRLSEEIRYFWSHKCFAVALPLITFLSYATLLTNPTVGIDDTSFKLYFVDGVAPAVGRWCLYLINKLIPLQYNPVFVEAVGLCFFCLSVTIWCVVFQRILGEEISVAAYALFACVMISSPIISELEVWYLQNGTYLAYGVTALAVLNGMESLREERGSRKRLVLHLTGSAFLLTVAIGFYESFMVVFLVAMLMCFLLVHYREKSGYTKKAGRWMMHGSFILVLGMVFRAVIVTLFTSVFHLETQKHVLDTRSFGDIWVQLSGWFSGERTGGEFFLMIKDFFVKYYLHAICYLPIMIFALAMGVLVILGCCNAFRKRNGWIVVAVLGITVAPLVLPIVEGYATFYRSAQFVPLVSAFSVLLVAWEFRGIRGKLLPYVGCVLAFVLLYQQGYEMNKWLYIDAVKYEDTVRTMDGVAMYIRENCDERLPVCVIGEYETPESLISEVYTPTWSKKYSLVRFFVSAVDERLFEKYNTQSGYAVAETPRLSFIKWGATAFFGTDRELIRFWNMRGFGFTEDGNLEHYREAKEQMKDKPVWPKPGSVVQTDEYIIVNFGFAAE